jgi:hypothetical protein
MRALGRILATFGLLLALGASAQPGVFFGAGKPPLFKEEDVDRRFAKSRLQRGLAQGTQHPACVQLLGGMLTVLAEAGPLLHKRDENFYLEPGLVNALQTQLSTPRFPAAAYLAAMVRRIQLDGKLPHTWLEVAGQINPSVGTIDVGKLRYLADGLRPIESFYFSLPALRQRYEVEVRRATSASSNTAVLAFRDAYLDRDVAWGGLYLVDVADAPVGASGMVARLVLPSAASSGNQLVLFANQKKEPEVRITARLAALQYLDVTRLPKGTRLLVRGRFWEMSSDLNSLELRDALLFEDRDWSRGAALADPAVVAQCPLAVNELAGMAPQQPGGFGTRR